MSQQTVRNKYNMKNSKVYVSSEQAARLMKQSKPGVIFSISYFSMKDNKVINRFGRMGVTKFLTGGGKSKPDSETGLTTYFDTVKGNYRSPRISNLKRFKVSGIEYIVK